jgi:predicted RNA-binding protein with PIN domain
MPLVRILVDAYSLLHNWPDLAPGRARHSAAARDELIHRLTQYRDAVGTPMTIVFDGTNAPKGTAKPISTPELEILYSRRGQTADGLIERAAHRLLPYGEVLVVTDDRMERETVIASGGYAQSCDEFIQAIRSALKELHRDVKRHNLSERNQFTRRHQR